MKTIIKDIIYLGGWVGMLLMMYITINTSAGTGTTLDVIGIMLGFIMMCAGFAMVETTKDI